MAVKITVNEPLRVIRGDTLIFDLAIAEDDGTSVNLTGVSIGLYISDGTAIVVEVVQNNHADASAGRTIIELPSSVTKNFTSDKTYFYEVKLFRNDFVKTLATGLMVVYDPIKVL